MGRERMTSQSGLLRFETRSAGRLPKAHFLGASTFSPSLPFKEPTFCPSGIERVLANRLPIALGHSKSFFFLVVVSRPRNFLLRPSPIVFFAPFFLPIEHPGIYVSIRSRPKCCRQRCPRKIPEPTQFRATGFTRQLPNDGIRLQVKPGRCGRDHARGPFCVLQRLTRRQGRTRKSPLFTGTMRVSPGEFDTMKTGWWCAQSVWRTRLSGDSTLETAAIRCFSAFFSQNGEFKSKGFGFRACYP